MLRRFALSLFVLLVFVVPATGREFERMRVDLDADRRMETITLSVTGSGDVQTFTLEMGGARYSDDFYARDGDLPELSIVRLDRSRGTRQLMIRIVEPASCRYHLLAYSDRKIHRLLRIDTDAECRAPESKGNGEIDVVTHEGFWERTDTYVLSTAGTLLTRIPRNIYEVGRSGTAARELILDGDECLEQTIPAGSLAEVVRYDNGAERYLVRSGKAICGWIPAAGLATKIPDLPWRR